MDFKKVFNEIRVLLEAAPMAKPVKEEIQAGDNPDSTSLTLKDGNSCRCRQTGSRRNHAR